MTFEPFELHARWSYRFLIFWKLPPPPCAVDNCFKHSLCPAQCFELKPFAAQVQYSRVELMASAAEDMTLGDFNRVCDGMVRCSLVSPFTSHGPQGVFHHLNIPMVEVETTGGNSSVHFLDLIKDNQLSISIEELERHYKAAVVNKDLQLLPPPFGLRSKVSSDCELQMIMSKDTAGSDTILKHIVFPNKCKVPVVKKLVSGVLRRPSFMQVPTVGRKILQYCLQNMSGLQFRCFDVTADKNACEGKGRMGQTPLHGDVETQATNWQECGCGAQIIDPFRGHLRTSLKHAPPKVRSVALARKIRAAQWMYWRRTQNLWAATGQMLQDPRA